MSQGFWMNLYRFWPWAGIPLMLAAAAGAARLAARLVKLTRQAPLFKVPLAPRQEVGFTEPGRVSLALEGARFTTRFSGLGFDLWGNDGQKAPGRASLLRPRTMGMTTITMELATFDIPRAGQYTLMIRGLDEPSSWNPAHAVVFLRFHIGRMVAYIVGIVLLAGVFLTSLVFVILRLAGVALAG